MALVKLTYFKKSGKYHGEGEYESKAPFINTKIFMRHIRDEIVSMKSLGNLPGFKDTFKQFYVCVKPENGEPKLFDL